MLVELLNLDGLGVDESSSAGDHRWMFKRVANHAKLLARERPQDVSFRPVEIIVPIELD